ncbi:FAD-dependent oxidoreductase [Spirillospora sp. NBC_00431]
MDIVVIGAGYAGLTTALRLDRAHNITLISAVDHFTQRIRLHEFAAGRPSVTVPLAELTRNTGIEVVTARVSSVDVTSRLVLTDDGGKFPYETLVYALGSRTDTKAPGVAEHAYTTETAGALRTRLESGGGDLAVVGGGLTGIELATELAETYPAWRVALVTRTEPGTGLSANGRARIAKAMTRLGITGHPNTRAEAVEPGRLRTDRGDIPADVVVWAASFAVPALAADAGLAVDDRGRARVDETLRSISHPDVYAVGDAAAVEIPGAGTSRMSCAVGMPIGAHAADVINARAAGREPKPFRFRYFIQCVSLGRRDGVIQAVRWDDSPVGLILRGRSAAFVKEFVCRFTLWSLRLERWHPGAYLWPKGRRPSVEGRRLSVEKSA